MPVLAQCLTLPQQAVVGLLASSYRGYAELSNMVAGWLVAAGTTEHDIEEMIKERLKLLVLQRFSATQADSIFAHMHSAPEWLDDLIKHPEWRALIYQVPKICDNPETNHL